MALTRWVAALLIPPLVTAFIVLYMFPSSDGRSFAFAWTIRPLMTGIVMGAGYLGGAYFFARVVGAVGICLILLATVVFIVPAPAIAAWPWTLTPLTTRIIASWMMLPGVGAVVILTNPDH